jgi:hypothetical protein
LRARAAIAALPAESTTRVALQALQRQLVSELVNRNANLLGNGTLDCDLLRKLAERRDDLLHRNVRACMAAKGGLLTQSKGELLAEGELLAKGKLLGEGRLLKRRLLAESGLSGVVTELSSAAVRAPVVRARLPERGLAHLRQPRRLRSGKLWQQALLGIL